MPGRLIDRRRPRSVVMKGKLHCQVGGTQSLELLGGNRTVVPIGAEASRKGQPRSDHETGDDPPWHPEPGVPLPYVMSEGGDH
jgi:hypothetical protein